MATSQAIIFLSLMTTIYFITKLIPFNVGEPLYVFFGVLFSYLAGSICIAYIYVLTTVDVMSNIFAYIAASQTIKNLLFIQGFSQGDPITVAMMNSIPDYIYTAVMIGGTYLGVTAGVFVCKKLIKKLRLIEKFGGIYA